MAEDLDFEEEEEGVSVEESLECSSCEGGSVTPEYRRFAQDMEEAGIPLRHYHGRFYYKGPAADSNERGWPTLQEIIRATEVSVQWDNLAMDWIVYPK